MSWSRSRASYPRDGDDRRFTSRFLVLREQAAHAGGVGARGMGREKVVSEGRGRGRSARQKEGFDAKDRRLERECAGRELARVPAKNVERALAAFRVDRASRLVEHRDFGRER